MMQTQPFLYVGKQEKRKNKTKLPTEIVMPVERNVLELLKQSMWILASVTAASPKGLEENGLKEGLFPIFSSHSAAMDVECVIGN